MAIDWESYGRERRTGQGIQPNRYRTDSYIDGNTVRKANAVPKRREETEARPEPKRYPKRQPVRMPGLSGRAFVFLTAMLVAMSLCGFSYLTQVEDAREMKSEIVSLQSEIMQMKEENEETYRSIVESVDLSEIYKRATEELHMVQAQNNQIYTYSNKKSDIVKQYADIPGAD